MGGVGSNSLIRRRWRIPVVSIEPFWGLALTTYLKRHDYQGKSTSPLVFQCLSFLHLPSATHAFSSHLHLCPFFPSSLTFSSSIRQATAISLPRQGECHVLYFAYKIFFCVFEAYIVKLQGHYTDEDQPWSEVRNAMTQQE